MAIEDGERSEFEGTLEYVAARWREADRGTLRHAFPLLARGRPVAPESLAERAGVSVAMADTAMRSGPLGLDADGALSELFGVMQAPTLHRVEVEGRAGFTCCAVVAHTLPALVDQAVTVESVDPLSRRVIKLRLSPRFHRASPAFDGSRLFPDDATERRSRRRARCVLLSHQALRGPRLRTGVRRPQLAAPSGLGGGAARSGSPACQQDLV